MFREYSISTAEIFSKPHLCAPLQSMSCQYTISPAHFQSIHHNYLLLMSCQNTTFPCPLPVWVPSLIPISNQNITSPTIVLSEYIFCPCPVDTPPLLPKSSQYITSPVHVTKSPAYVNWEYQLSCLCPIIIPPLLPTIIQRVHHLMPKSSQYMYHNAMPWYTP